MNKNKKGLFIVIDGTDGSGKATQTKALLERLQNSGISATSVSFPCYGQNSSAMVSLYLDGKLGDKSLTNNPYVVSSFYAADRYLNADKIRKALDEGTIVVCDRYVAANMGHQGSKIEMEEERQKFFHWLYDYEYIKLGIPIPDLNIILHVPTEISQSLIQKRGSRKDLHEADIDHLRRAEQVYLTLPRLFPDKFSVISCYESDKLYNPEEIHELVWKKIKPLLSK